MGVYFTWSMKLIIQSKDTTHYRSHGFGALMNKALRLCWLHFEKYGNWNVEFQDYQLEELFTNPAFGESESYVKDLIWDDDGPKNIVKNRLAFDNCFRNRSKVKFESGTNDWIGVHARGTDKVTECKLVSIPAICSHINKFEGMIFIATEDQKRFLELKRIYGGRIVNCSTPSETTHHVVGPQRLKINLQAYLDAQVLSQSKVFLACNSNLSELAKAMRHPDLPIIDMQIL